MFAATLLWIFQFQSAAFFNFPEPITVEDLELQASFIVDLLQSNSIRYLLQQDAHRNQPCGFQYTNTSHFHSWKIWSVGFLWMFWKKELSVFLCSNYLELDRLWNSLLTCFVGLIFSWETVIASHGQQIRLSQSHSRYFD